MFLGGWCDREEVFGVDFIEKNKKGCCRSEYIGNTLKNNRQ